MITLLDFYHVMTAVVPLYVAMALAYASVKWWNIFTPEQCSGINRFVALFPIPLLSFHVLSMNNPYAMNLRFIAAEILQKVIVLVFLAIWSKCSSTRGSLDWTITLFSLLTLPNTLIVGIPLLKGIYGESTGSLLVQVVVLQSIIWYTLLLFMFEYRGAKILISEQFPDTASSIASIRVDSEVTSLDERWALETEVVVNEDERLHVIVKRSSASQSDILSSSTRSRSNLTEVVFHSSRSSINPSPGESSFNEVDFNTMSHGSRNSVLGASDITRVESSSKRVSKVDEEGGEKVKKVKAMPSTRIIARLILVMVWRKIVRNPNTYASILGIAWSLVSFRWGVKMPEIVAKSTSILADAGVGMAMFSLGLFMALQPRLIACGKSMAMVSMAIRFVGGPALMAAASGLVGIRHLLLRVAIVQAAIPQGIIPFIFAKEYNLHAEVLSTSVIFGMIMAVPVTLLYYIVLEL